MNDSGESLEREFSDQAARRIIERAMELDQRDGGRIPEAELREIARQLDISDRAVTLAIGEMIQVRLRGPRHIDWRQLVAPIVAVTTGGAVGLWLRSTGRELHLGLERNDPLFAVLALQVLALCIAIGAKGVGKQRRFQLTNIAMWSAFVAGWSLVHGYATDLILSIGLGYGLATALGGGAAVLLKDVVARMRTSSGATGTGAGSTSQGPTPRSLLARLLTKVRDTWFTSRVMAAAEHRTA